MTVLPPGAGKGTDNDSAFNRFVDALDGYLGDHFGCQSPLVERPVSGRCVSASSETFSLYVRYKSGLYDSSYDRPVTIARMDCAGLEKQRDSLLRFLVDHADEHDLGTVILESADYDTCHDAPLLGFRPCGIHFRNWHASVQDLKQALQRLDLAGSRAASAAPVY